MSEQPELVPCRDCGEPCIDAGPGLGWQCVSAVCGEKARKWAVEQVRRDHPTQAELTRLRAIEAAAREAVAKAFANHHDELEMWDAIHALRAALEGK